MKIAPFGVEQWMNDYEVGAKYNIAETCVDSVSLDELFELTGLDQAAFWKEFSARRLTYGDIFGAPEFREGVCKLYKTVEPDQVLPCHGAAGANHHVFYTLAEPGDHIVTLLPTYQQLYSIPQSFGADVEILRLSKESGYQPDMEALRKAVTPGTRMICLNNPNNPTGARIPNETLKEIVELARRVGAYVISDETYRHLSQTDEWDESIADLYEKGISVSSMSKTFSLAGLRLGWIATRDGEAMEAMKTHRDYDLISCSMFSEAVAAIALNHSGPILARNHKIVRENLAVLDAWVNAEPRVSYVKPQAGTTALVYYDMDVPSREFCHRMYHETGALVTPGDCFEEPHSVRVGYACEPQMLKDGLAAFSQFLRKLEKEGK